MHKPPALNKPIVSGFASEQYVVTLLTAVVGFLMGSVQAWPTMRHAACLQAVEEQGAGRAINRHRFSLEEAEANLERPVVRALLQLMRFRNTHPAFNGQVCCIFAAARPCTRGTRDKCGISQCRSRRH